MKNQKKTTGARGRIGRPIGAWAMATVSESGAIKLPTTGGKTILESLREPISADDADFLINELDAPSDLKKFIKSFWETTTTVVYLGRSYVVKIGRFLIALIGKVWDWLVRETPGLWDSLKKHYPKTVSLVLLFVILFAIAHLVPIIGGIVAGLLAAVGAAIAAVSAIIETMENAGIMEQVRQAVRMVFAAV